MTTHRIGRIVIGCLAAGFVAEEIGDLRVD